MPILLIGALILLILIGAVLNIRGRLIFHSHDELIKALDELRSGNLDYQFKKGNSDRSGKLASAYDNLRVSLKLYRREMEQRFDELKLLNLVGRTVGESLDLPKVLDLALQTVTERLGMETGLIFLCDAASNRYILRAAKGASSELCSAIEKQREIPEGDISAQVVNSGQPVYVPDMYGDPRFEGLWEELHNRSYINVPLKSKGKLIGTMCLISEAGKPAPDSTVSIVEAVGSQLGILIENAQLYHELRYLAVLEERDRLAREMHDELAQALGYLNIKASITQDLLSNGQIEQTAESLAELKTVTKTVYTDVREAIFNLRTSVAMRTGFIPTLSDYLDEYRTTYGMDVELQSSYQDKAEIPLEVANQLLRIVQEALTNVRKHAQANKVTVQCFQNRSQVFICVEDDGMGFDPTKVDRTSRQHIGLQVMFERAESIGGRLEFISGSGAGTRVGILVPL